MIRVIAPLLVSLGIVDWIAPLAAAEPIDSASATVDADGLVLNYADGFLIASKRERNESSHAALCAALERLIAVGVEHLHYLPGELFLGDDGEGTVDSSHPTDLGFMRQAAAFHDVLEPLVR